MAQLNLGQPNGGGGAAPQVMAQLTITLTSDGQIRTEGAIDNKLLAYGLLEVAKETISDHCKQAERLVQPVTLRPQFG